MYRQKLAVGGELIFIELTTTEVTNIGPGNPLM